MNVPTAHVDTFARDCLPPRDLWPEFRFDLPELQYPERLNCGRVLLDDALSEGHGERIALYSDACSWTYAELAKHANRIANVLMLEMGVVPGNRVLLHGTNTRMLVCAWLAVMKVGAIAVTTMPLLRAKELAVIATRARIEHALCDISLAAELKQAAAASSRLSHVLTWGSGELESAAQRQSVAYEAVETARDDVCVLAFTSGTTGNPKVTMHFHRDVLAMADVVGRHLLRTSRDDVYLGSPPLGFTFGLGALLVLPLRFRAASALVVPASPQNLLAGVQKFRATCLFTAPTMYRQLAALASDYDLSSLRRCISAGEPLTQAVSDEWYSRTGIRIADGIGATEMMHIFIGSIGADTPPGATGRPLPGYEACVLDADGRPLPRGSTGRLAVKGPTGCRYLDDPRQPEYVQNGWNVTGDIYHVDADGYFWFQARADDMIVSSGYNIAGPEVEAALLGHRAVKECACVAAPDAQRGQIVKAFIVTNDGYTSGLALAKELQDFVKRSIAPYKYPRAIEFMQALPKTQTGKIQRHALRARERADVHSIGQEHLARVGVPPSSS